MAQEATDQFQTWVYCLPTKTGDYKQRIKALFLTTKQLFLNKQTNPMCTPACLCQQPLILNIQMLRQEGCLIDIMEVKSENKNTENKYFQQEVLSKPKIFSEPLTDYLLSDFCNSS